MAREWPQEIRGPVVLGNFRERGPKERHKSTWRQERSGMSEAHLALIRQMPCCVTGIVGRTEAHHLKADTGERALGVRSTDKWAVPLSQEAHAELERLGSRKERQWFRDRGVEPTELARSLWENTGDLEKMIRVLVAHREHFAEHD